MLQMTIKRSNKIWNKPSINVIIYYEDLLKLIKISACSYPYGCNVDIYR